ncbi:MAG: T9SS type A sorting domain-containing protein [Bacteroidota bacterium]
MIWRIVILMITLWSSSNLNAQKHDFQWLFGARSAGTVNEVENINFDFNDRPASLDIVDSTDLVFFYTGTRISDSTGNLLFYSNGCEIKNRFGVQMENGNSINPGTVADFYCDPNDVHTYPGSAQSMLSLPQPGHDSLWYVFHNTIEIEPFIHIGDAKYSIIDMHLDSGAGAVSQKGIVYDTFTANGQLTAARSADMSAWLIPVAKRSNESISVYRLDSTGFELQHQQSIGINSWPQNEGGSSYYTRFSPDGTLYARYGLGLGLELFDFDRETGIFSNYRFLEPPLDDTIGFGGIEFSPNGRFIYIANIWHVEQLDLWAPTLEEGLERIFSVPDEDLDTLFPPVLAYPQLGPDCRLYIFCGSCSSVHLIHRPNELGQDCMLEYKAFETPTSYFRGTPVFPKYRMKALGDTSSICDHVTASVISSTSDPTISGGQEMFLYPNPAQDEIRLLWPEETGDIHWRLYDLQGSVAVQGNVSQQLAHEALRIDVQSLVPGIYIIHAQDENGFSWVKRFVKD